MNPLGKHQNVKIGQHNTIKIRSVKNHSKELFNQKLSEVQFPDYSNFENVNEAYADLSSKLIGVIDSIAPLKQIQLKTNTERNSTNKTNIYIYIYIETKQTI